MPTSEICCFLGNRFNQHNYRLLITNIDDISTIIYDITTMVDDNHGRSHQGKHERFGFKGFKFCEYFFIDMCAVFKLKNSVILTFT